MTRGKPAWRPKKKRQSVSIGRIMAFTFLGIILIGTILLTLPVSSRDGQSAGIMTALFTATSATCVTGLVLADTWTQWSNFGQVVILMMIEVGGLGFMSAASLAYFSLRRKISIQQQLVMAEAIGSNMNDVVEHQKRLLIRAFTVEGIGAVILWILAFTNFFVYIIRFTILDWGSTFLTQFKGLSIQTASTTVAASEIVGGIIGTLLAGWATDKFFKSKAQCTSAICTILAVICLFVFWQVKDIPWLFIAMLVLSAFFIYGPQALLGIAASNQATKRAAATANGIVGIVCYLSPIVSGAVFGAIADNPNMGWNGVYLAAIIMGIVGAVLLALLWNKPADGYAKADKLLDQVRADYEMRKAGK